MGTRRRWTDDDLRDAVREARSWQGVRDALGLVGGGSTNRLLRRRAAELELDVSHLPGPGEFPRSWTDDDLRRAVASATSLHGVFRHLGLAVGGAAWRRMEDHIVRLGLDTSHWTAGSVRPGSPRAPRGSIVEFGDDELERALRDAASLAQVIRRLGLDPARRSSYRRVQERIEQRGLSTEHLAGRAWARDGRGPGRRGRPLEEVLVRDSRYGGGSVRLKKRLLAAGLLQPCCAACGLEEWCARPAPLQLDHVNGDAKDNRLENLRLLCPNCHALTDTYCGRNIRGRYSPDQADL